MSPRKRDRFAQNIARGRRDRQRRKQQRSSRRSAGELSLFGEKSQNLKDGIKGGSKEVGLLGLEVGKGMIRETASFGADFLITSLTLPFAEPSTVNRGRNGSRRRRC